MSSEHDRGIAALLLGPALRFHELLISPCAVRTNLLDFKPFEAAENLDEYNEEVQRQIYDGIRFERSNRSRP